MEGEIQKTTWPVEDSVYMNLTTRPTKNSILIHKIGLLKPCSGQKNKLKLAFSGTRLLSFKGFIDKQTKRRSTKT